MTFQDVYAAIPARYPELKNQVALITGAATGIGLGIAMRLAREGMRLFLVDYNADALAQTLENLQGVGATVASLVLDLSQQNAHEVVFDALDKAYGTLDVLVNNAADLRRVPFLSEHTALLDYQIALGIRFPYLATQRAALMMKDRKGGNIINLSSVGGERAHDMGLPYDVPKGGINMLTRATAIELAEYNIRVNAIAPGAIYSRPEMSNAPDYLKLIPLNRRGTTLEIGAAVAFLISPDAAYVTGEIFYVDGGITAQLSPPGIRL